MAPAPQPLSVVAARMAARVLAERGIATLIALGVLAFGGWAMVHYADMLLGEQQRARAEFREALQRCCH